MIPTKPGLETIKFDVDNRVPFFPPKGRHPKLQKLVDSGMTREVRKLESLTDEQLEKGLTEYRAYVGAYKEVRKAYQSAEEMMADPQAREKILANARKRPRGAAHASRQRAQPPTQCRILTCG